jgi:hypothetical protein
MPGGAIPLIIYGLRLLNVPICDNFNISLKVALGLTLLSLDSSLGLSAEPCIEIVF